MNASRHYSLFKIRDSGLKIVTAFRHDIEVGVNLFYRLWMFQKELKVSYPILRALQAFQQGLLVRSWGTAGCTSTHGCFWNWHCQIVPDRAWQLQHLHGSVYCWWADYLLCWFILGVPPTCWLSQVCGGVPCCFARLRWVACVARGLAIHRLSLVASSRSLCSTSHWTYYGLCFNLLELAEADRTWMITAAAQEHEVPCCPKDHADISCRSDFRVAFL